MIASPLATDVCLTPRYRTRPQPHASPPTTAIRLAIADRSALSPTAPAFLLCVLVLSGSQPLFLENYSNLQAWTFLQRYTDHQHSMDVFFSHQFYVYHINVLNYGCPKVQGNM